MASDTETSCVSDPNFAVICSFLEKFAKSCGITHPNILELQEMLENSQEVPQPLIDLHVKLLRKARKSVSGERWEKAIIKFCHSYSNQDGWEIERFGYKKARIGVKLRILKMLLEIQFDLNTKFKTEVNKLSADELRCQPLGRDKMGQTYWCQLDEDCNLRVYREDLDDETWEIVARDREGLAQLISQLSSNDPFRKDTEALLNEDSNSLEIDKPVTDTGQIVDLKGNPLEPFDIDDDDDDEEFQEIEEEYEESDERENDNELSINGKEENSNNTLKSTSMYIGNQLTPAENVSAPDSSMNDVNVKDMEADTAPSEKSISHDKTQKIEPSEIDTSKSVSLNDFEKDTIEPVPSKVGVQDLEADLSKQVLIGESKMELPGAKVSEVLQSEVPKINLTEVEEHDQKSSVSKILIKSPEVEATTEELVKKEAEVVKKESSEPEILLKKEAKQIEHPESNLPQKNILIGDPVKTIIKTEEIKETSQETEMSTKVVSDAPHSSKLSTIPKVSEKESPEVKSTISTKMELMGPVSLRKESLYLELPTHISETSPMEKTSSKLNTRGESAEVSAQEEPSKSLSLIKPSIISKEVPGPVLSEKKIPEQVVSKIDVSSNSAPLQITSPKSKKADSGSKEEIKETILLGNKSFLSIPSKNEVFLSSSVDDRTTRLSLPKNEECLSPKSDAFQHSDILKSQVSPCITNRNDFDHVSDNSQTENTVNQSKLLKNETSKSNVETTKNLLLKPIELEKLVLMTSKGETSDSMHQSEFVGMDLSKSTRSRDIDICPLPSIGMDLSSKNYSEGQAYHSQDDNSTSSSSLVAEDLSDISKRKVPMLESFQNSRFGMIPLTATDLSTRRSAASDLLLPSKSSIMGVVQDFSSVPLNCVNMSGKRLHESDIMTNEAKKLRLEKTLAANCNMPIPTTPVSSLSRFRSENFDSEDSTEVGEAIEEPLMLVRGEGSGADCDTGNSRKDGESSKSCDAGSKEQVPEKGTESVDSNSSSTMGTKICDVINKVPNSDNNSSYCEKKSEISVMSKLTSVKDGIPEDIKVTSSPECIVTPRANETMLSSFVEKNTSFVSTNSISNSKKEIENSHLPDSPVPNIKDEKPSLSDVKHLQSSQKCSSREQRSPDKHPPKLWSIDTICAADQDKVKDFHKPKQCSSSLLGIVSDSLYGDKFAPTISPTTSPTKRPSRWDIGGSDKSSPKKGEVSALKSSVLQKELASSAVQDSSSKIQPGEEGIFSSVTEGEASSSNSDKPKEQVRQKQKFKFDIENIITVIGEKQRKDMPIKSFIPDIKANIYIDKLQIPEAVSTGQIEAVSSQVCEAPVECKSSIQTENKDDDDERVMSSKLPVQGFFFGPGCLMKSPIKKTENSSAVEDSTKTTLPLDEQRVSQISDNLIDNEVKYFKPSAVVENVQEKISSNPDVTTLSTSVLSVKESPSKLSISHTIDTIITGTRKTESLKSKIEMVSSTSLSQKPYPDDSSIISGNDLVKTLERNITVSEGSFSKDHEGRIDPPIKLNICKPECGSNEKLVGSDKEVALKGEVLDHIGKTEVVTKSSEERKLDEFTCAVEFSSSVDFCDKEKSLDKDESKNLIKEISRNLDKNGPKGCAKNNSVNLEKGNVSEGKGKVVETLNKDNEKEDKLKSVSNEVSESALLKKSLNKQENDNFAAVGSSILTLEGKTANISSEIKYTRASDMSDSAIKSEKLRESKEPIDTSREIKESAILKQVIHNDFKSEQMVLESQQNVALSVEKQGSLCSLPVMPVSEKLNVVHNLSMAHEEVQLKIDGKDDIKLDKGAENYPKSSEKESTVSVTTVSSSANKVYMLTGQSCSNTNETESDIKQSTLLLQRNLLTSGDQIEYGNGKKHNDQIKSEIELSKSDNSNILKLSTKGDDNDEGNSELKSSSCVTLNEDKKRVEDFTESAISVNLSKDAAESNVQKEVKIVTDDKKQKEYKEKSLLPKLKKGCTSITKSECQETVTIEKGIENTRQSPILTKDDQSDVSKLKQSSFSGQQVKFKEKPVKNPSASLDNEKTNLDTDDKKFALKNVGKLVLDDGTNKKIDKSSKILPEFKDVSLNSSIPKGSKLIEEMKTEVVLPGARGAETIMVSETTGKLSEISCIFSKNTIGEEKDSGVVTDTEERSVNSAVSRDQCYVEEVIEKSRSKDGSKLSKVVEKSKQKDDGQQSILNEDVSLIAKSTLTKKVCDDSSNTSCKDVNTSPKIVETIEEQSKVFPLILDEDTSGKTKKLDKSEERKNTDSDLTVKSINARFSEDQKAASKLSEKTREEVSLSSNLKHSVLITSTSQDKSVPDEKFHENQSSSKDNAKSSSNMTSSLPSKLKNEAQIKGRRKSLESISMGIMMSKLAAKSSLQEHDDVASVVTEHKSLSHPDIPSSGQGGSSHSANQTVCVISQDKAEMKDSGNLNLHNTSSSSRREEETTETVDNEIKTESDLSEHSKPLPALKDKLIETEASIENLSSNTDKKQTFKSKDAEEKKANSSQKSDDKITKLHVEWKGTEANKTGTKEETNKDLKGENVFGQKKKVCKKEIREDNESEKNKIMEVVCSTEEDIEQKTRGDTDQRNQNISSKIGTNKKQDVILERDQLTSIISVGNSKESKQPENNKVDSLTEGQQSCVSPDSSEVMKTTDILKVGAKEVEMKNKNISATSGENKTDGKKCIESLNKLTEKEEQIKTLIADDKNLDSSISESVSESLKKTIGNEPFKGETKSFEQSITKKEEKQLSKIFAAGSFQREEHGEKAVHVEVTDMEVTKQSCDNTVGSKLTANSKKTSQECNTEAANSTLKTGGNSDPKDVVLSSLPDDKAVATKNSEKTIPFESVVLEPTKEISKSDSKIFKEKKDKSDSKTSKEREDIKHGSINLDDKEDSKSDHKNSKNAEDTKSDCKMLELKEVTKSDSKTRQEGEEIKSDSKTLKEMEEFKPDSKALKELNDSKSKSHNLKEEEENQSYSNILKAKDHKKSDSINLEEWEDRKSISQNLEEKEENKSDSNILKKKEHKKSVSKNLKEKDDSKSVSKILKKKNSSKSDSRILKQTVATESENLGSSYEGTGKLAESLDNKEQIASAEEAVAFLNTPSEGQISDIDEEEHSPDSAEHITQDDDDDNDDDELHIPEHKISRRQKDFEEIKMVCSSNKKAKQRRDSTEGKLSEVEDGTCLEETIGVGDASSSDDDNLGDRGNTSDGESDAALEHVHKPDPPRSRGFRGRRGRGRGWRGRSRGHFSTRTASPAPTLTEILSKEDEHSSPGSTPSKPKRGKRAPKLMGLDVGVDIILDQSRESDGRSGLPVRQSRRIAQMKIREEAERRQLEELTLQQLKDEQSRRKVDVEVSKKNAKEGKKRKKKYIESDEETTAEEIEIEESPQKKLKKKKKRRKKKPALSFNESNPWKSSSGSSTSQEEEEEVEQTEEEEEDEELVFESDHEFSPESDLENDATEVTPTKRARTAQKGQLCAEDEEEPADEHACQKCGKSDHPEWILLCDKCDAGWHGSCLRPALMVIPEGDWFCPPCEHTSLLENLHDSLLEFDRNWKKRENEELRRKRLAYVGISLDNVLPNKEKGSGGESDPDTKRGARATSPSGSESSRSDSDSSSGDDSEPVYQLRERRQTLFSYRFNEYDDLINSAIQDEMEAVKGAGNQGRGKDISTIVKAEAEEKEAALKEKEQQEKGEVKVEGEQEIETGAQAETIVEEIPSVVPKHEAKDEEEDDEDDFCPFKKFQTKKKHRRLNSLDISSEDDAESDEDFKGSSSDDDEDDYEASDGDSDDSEFAGRRGRKGRRSSGPVRRSSRARVTRFDKEFINDDSEDSQPPKKKSRRLFQETESEESDASWGRSKKPKKYVTTYKVKERKKKKKRSKRGIDSDLETYKVKKPKIKYGGLDDDDDDDDVSPTRRTRGRKINYQEFAASESEEDTWSKTRKLDSEDEYVANEEEDEEEEEVLPDLDKDSENDTGGESTESKKVDKSKPGWKGKNKKLTKNNFEKSPKKGKMPGKPRKMTVIDSDDEDDDLDDDGGHPEETVEQETGAEVNNGTSEVGTVLCTPPEVEVPVVPAAAAPVPDFPKERRGRTRGQGRKMIDQPRKTRRKKKGEMGDDFMESGMQKEQGLVQDIYSGRPVNDISLPPQTRRGEAARKANEALMQRLNTGRTGVNLKSNSDISEVDRTLLMHGKGSADADPLRSLLAAPPVLSSEGEMKASEDIQPPVGKRKGGRRGKAAMDTSKNQDLGHYPLQTFPPGAGGSNNNSSVITRMLQTQPVSGAPQSFTAAAAAMGHKYFGNNSGETQVMPMQNAGRGGPSVPPYSGAPKGLQSQYRQPPPPIDPSNPAIASGMGHYGSSPGRGTGIRGAPPPNFPQTASMRMRNPSPGNQSHMFHTSHHPMDPSPSGGGPIIISSSAGPPPPTGSPHTTKPGTPSTSHSTPTPPPPPYSRPGSQMPLAPPASTSMAPMVSFPIQPGDAQPSGRPTPSSFPPVSPASHLQNPQSAQQSPPPHQGRSPVPGNFSPYHPPPPANYHYGGYPPPPPMSAADDALPPSAFQGSPYTDHYTSSEISTNLQASDGSNSKPYEEEGGGEFGGLVSYFSSQREDDLDT